MFGFYTLASVVAVIAIVGAVMVSHTPETYLPNAVPQSQTVAPGLVAFREAAWQFVRDNPTYTGSLPSSALLANLRAPIGNVDSYNALIQANWLYVWAGTTSPAIGSSVQSGRIIAEEAAKLSDGSRLVGYNVGGFLVSPAYGTSTIALPTSIPQGAPVVVRPLIP